MNAKKTIALVMSGDLRSPGEIARENEWEITHASGDEHLQTICANVIARSPKQLNDYIREEGRRDRVVMWFVGQVMKELKGKGNPEEIGKEMVRLLLTSINK